MISPAVAKRIEIWPIDRLVPYSKNPRTHSDEQVPAIAERAAALEWRTVPRFPSYAVSESGDVRRAVAFRQYRAGMLLKQKAHPYGHRSVALSVNGKRREVYVHRLVAHAFLGPAPSEAHQIAHNDGNPKNNHWRNLRWATASENALDKRRHGTVPDRKGERHPMARLSGAPKLYRSRLYVPVSSHEEVSPASAKYECCTFRGSVVALDAESGKQIWKTHTIPDPPRPTKKNPAGVQMHGPAGAAVWLSPAIDVKRNALYIGTGNAYSDPETGYSDAVIAMDLDTGSVKWVRQLTGGDGWNFSCISPNKANCPASLGEDVDIGASPILKDLPGNRSVLLIGQKSAVVYALDPDQQGRILWQTRIGKGGAMGGIVWGMGADEQRVYVPLSDIRERDNAGGLFAIRIASGERAWYAPPVTPACAGKPGCSKAQLAPPTVIPGVVFSGSMDGTLRAHDATDGAVIWEFNTLRDFETVNGVKARGGSLNATGPVIAGGMMFLNSGYGILGGMAGNVLLAFAAE